MPRLEPLIMELPCREDDKIANDTINHRASSQMRWRRQQQLRGETMKYLPSALFLSVALLGLLAPQISALEEPLVRFRRQATEESATSDIAGGTTTTITTTTTTQAPSTTASSEPQQPKKTKAPPVNFTLVDEIFESTLDEPEVVAKWKHMDKQIVDGVRSILKIVFPHIVSMASDAKVSGACSGAMLKWILNLRNMRSWAVKSKYLYI